VTEGPLDWLITGLHRVAVVAVYEHRRARGLPAVWPAWVTRFREPVPDTHHWLWAILRGTPPIV
jgi:hypothetical protein